MTSTNSTAVSRPEDRSLILVANIIGVGCHPGAWRLTPGDPSRFVSAAHLVDTARIAEESGFDAVFFPDIPALREDIRTRPPQVLDPTVALGFIAAATTRIGLIGTASTTYEQPYNIAKRFATLNQLSEGRAGWNVVTTAQPDAPGNFGLADVPPSTQRYARAKESLGIVLRLWSGWPQDALVGDIHSGLFAHTENITPPDFHGEYLSVKGPLGFPAGTPRPLIVQAGTSPQGVEFGATTADAIFAPALTWDQANNLKNGLRTLSQGRTDGIVPALLPGVVTVIGETTADAQDRLHRLEALSDPADNLARFSRLVHAEPGTLRPDAPLPPSLLDPNRRVEGTTGFLRSIADYIADLEHTEERSPTVAELLTLLSGGGHRVLVGSPHKIADDLERWFQSGAVDGFTIMADALPDGLRSFGREVVPLLREKGIVNDLDSPGTGVRDNAGITGSAVSSVAHHSGTGLLTSLRTRQGYATKTSATTSAPFPTRSS